MPMQDCPQKLVSHVWMLVVSEHVNLPLSWHHEKMRRRLFQASVHRNGERKRPNKKHTIAEEFAFDVFPSLRGDRVPGIDGTYNSH
jgi:hypothetical protein